MTLGSGPFRSQEEAKQPSDWQKHANRVALNIRVVRTLPDAHIRGWDSALDRSRVLQRCRVDYCVRPCPITIIAELSRKCSVCTEQTLRRWLTLRRSVPAVSGEVGVP